MKKLALLLSVAFIAMQAIAANVDRATAQAKAEAFLKASVAPSGQKLATGPVKFVSERTVTNSSNVLLPVFYIFNTQERFIIVSGEDRSEEILAVGDEPLDFNNIPANMQYWLDRYQEQIEYLQAHPGLQVQLQSKLMAPSMRAQSVSQLLTARWDQTQPFWNQCIFNGTQCLTGCPATSLAQVFYYWKYPTDPTPALTGYTTGGYTIPALPSTTFDWANMKDYYGWSGSSGTAAQKAAVATLMRYIGQAEKMGYGPDGSGISSSRTDLISSACKTFGYDNNVQAIYKQTAWGTNIYSDSQWATMIQNELAAGHPIVYCALSTQSGHAFNVDGYNATDNTYHINWGWSGVGNAYYALNAFTYDGETFNDYQSMVIGIQPPGGVITFPSIVVEPESLDFGTVNTGETVTRTFHVSGVNLLADVTFTKSGSSTYYSVSPETLTVAEVEAGATVTVTYAPTGTANGTHSATINVNSSGAESKSVAVTAVANPVPTLVADPSELSFNAAVGETVTGTFTLTGYNLTGGAYLSVVNSTGGFTIDKSNATKTAVTNGLEVTVTYKPTTPGNHTARVMLRSKDADTIYVQLNGTAAFNKYTPVMQSANAAYVTQTSFRADWTDQTPAGGVSSYVLQCNNTAGGAALTFNNITNKFYTIENLTAGATYSYKVKAMYVDGTESDWSNTQQVTLLSAPAFENGDVNHDGFVDINDVTSLIDYLLGSGTIYTDCADVNSDTAIDISDVTTLIDMLLAGN